MKRKTYSGLIDRLGRNRIFVFGSNPEGRHGKGTAKLAVNKYGAVYGQGRGLQGQSYGLITTNLRSGYHDPVRDEHYPTAGPRSVSKKQIIANIKELYKIARSMRNKEFYVAYTADGSNLNGYTAKDMAKLFYQARPIPLNIVFEDKFMNLVYPPSSGVTPLS